MNIGFVVFLLLGLRNSVAGKQKGNSCVDSHTSGVGRCLPPKQCITAKNDFLSKGIRPTICNGSSEQVLICCRKDISTQKRVSERMCQEYSRFKEEVQFIPLIQELYPVSVSVAKCDRGVELIVGGIVADIGEFPHMAAIGWRNEGGYSIGCSGSLISSKFVLTAGHCTRNSHAAGPTPAIVRLGDQNVDSSVIDGADPIEVPIIAIHQHPEFMPTKRVDNIALLELGKEVEFTKHIRPACLWSKPDFGHYKTALVTSWITNEAGNQTASNELLKISLPLFDNDHCEQLIEPNDHLWTRLDPKQICAGDLRRGNDLCQVNGGSPLQVLAVDDQCIFYIMGVTKAHKCTRSGQPAVYTRVSSYLDWIESVVWPEYS